MTGFLTIEDANTSNLNIINEFYCLDTSLLGESDFSNKRYDFVKISKTSTSYSLEVDNSLWTGGFYVTDSTGEYIDVTDIYNYDSSNHILEFDVNESNICIYLYLSSFADSVTTEVITLKILDNINRPIFSSNNHNISFKYKMEDFYGHYYEGMYLSFVKNNGEIEYYDYIEFTGYHGGAPSSEFDIYLDVVVVKDNVKGIILSTEPDSIVNALYLKIFSYKVKPDIRRLADVLFLGEVNTIELYSASFIQLTGFARCNGILSEIYIKDGYYCFDVDLKDYNHSYVTVELFLLENEDICTCEYSFNINTRYRFVDSASEMLEMINKGNTIINLNNDITIADDILITNPIIIEGNGHCIDLNEHSIILSEGVDCRLENLVLDKGDNAIIQGKNTKLDLTGVSFRNCISSNYNNQGACILCDIDINSLDNTDDYITNLKDCSFIDNHNCIVHGGVLNISNCSYLNTDISYTDKHNVGFLYQVDGESTITSSRFDINYISDEYCLNQESIGYAQAILKIGRTASINNYSHEDFINNRFNFNNQCHVFCKYYYEKIGECVYTSPVNGKESESYCYSASGTNWVFKENVQVTRASSNRENTYNPLME